MLRYSSAVYIKVAHDVHIKYVHIWSAQCQPVAESEAVQFGSCPKILDR